MAVEFYDGFYISANQYDVGPSSGTPSAYQLSNANNIYSHFHELGWTDNAICGMIGNIMYESCIDPACVYPKSSFPHGGADISDLDNIYAINITSPAYGLVQWKGTTQTPPAGNQIVSYAMRHGYQWYSGDIQLQRLTWEYQEPAKFHPQTVDGVYWTFASYASSTASPETLAKVWMVCYEGTYSVLDIRKQNARDWYTIYAGTTPTGGWVDGETFAALAVAYDPDITGQQIPYSQMDCIQFVQKVWRDIDAVSNTDVLCSPLGTNTLWRMNVSPYGSKTFNTTDPNGNTPTEVLWYKDDLTNVESIYGGIPIGSLLFHQISEAGPPAIPAQYAGDGLGNFVHVGIYIGNGEVMQSGGQDSGSVPGGGVHRSSYDPNAWNYVAFVVWVDPTATGPTPPPPHPHLPKYLMMCYNKKKKGVVKNVRKWVL